MHHYKAEDDELVKLIHVDRCVDHYIVILCLIMVISLRWCLELGVKIHAYAPNKSVKLYHIMAKINQQRENAQPVSL